MSGRPARIPRVTKADMQRAVALVRMLGMKPGAIEAEPGRIRIIAGDQALTVGQERAEDQEFQKFLAANGVR